MSSWRPEDWKNPDECLCELDWVKALGECGDMRHHSYEAGADAMLEVWKRTVDERMEKYLTEFSIVDFTIPDKNIIKEHLKKLEDMGSIPEVNNE